MFSENRLKVGQILPNKSIRQGDKNPDDGITSHEGMIIIIKDVKIKRGATKKASIKIDAVRERYAFGSLLLGDEDE